MRCQSYTDRCVRTRPKNLLFNFLGQVRTYLPQKFIIQLLKTNVLLYRNRQATAHLKQNISPKQKHAPLSLRNFSFFLRVLSNKQIISLKASIIEGDFISQILHQSKGFKFGRILGFFSDSSCFDFGFDRTLGECAYLWFYNVICLFGSLVEAWLATKWVSHTYIATSTHLVVSYKNFIKERWQPTNAIKSLCIWWVDGNFLDWAWFRILYIDPHLYYDFDLSWSNLAFVICLFVGLIEYWVWYKGIDIVYISCWKKWNSKFLSWCVRTDPYKIGMMLFIHYLEKRKYYLHVFRDIWKRKLPQII